MKKLSLRTVSLILTLCMAFSMLPYAALATGDEPVNPTPSQQTDSSDGGGQTDDEQVALPVEEGSDNGEQPELPDEQQPVDEQPELPDEPLPDEELPDEPLPDEEQPDEEQPIVEQPTDEPALSAQGGLATLSEPVEIDSWVELVDAFANASDDSENPTSMKLTADMTADDSASGPLLSLGSGKFVVLDLNGNKLSAPAFNKAFIANEGSLEIISGGAGGCIYNFSDAGAPYSCIENRGVLKLTSGTIGNPSASGDFVFISNNAGGVFEMTGGEIGSSGGGKGALLNQGEATLRGGAIYRGDVGITHAGNGATLKLGEVSINAASGGQYRQVDIKIGLDVDQSSDFPEPIALLSALSSDIYVEVGDSLTPSDTPIFVAESPYVLTTDDAAHIKPAEGSYLEITPNVPTDVKASLTADGPMARALNGGTGEYTLIGNVTLTDDLFIGGAPSADNENIRTASLNLGGHTINCGEYGIHVGYEFAQTAQNPSFTFTINPADKTAATLAGGAITGEGVSVLSIFGDYTDANIYGVTISNAYTPADGAAAVPSSAVYFGGDTAEITRSVIVGSDAASSAALYIEKGTVSSIINTEIINGDTGLFVGADAEVTSIDGDSTYLGINDADKTEIAAKYIAVEVEAGGCIETIGKAALTADGSDVSVDTSALLNAGAIGVISNEATLTNTAAGAGHTHAALRSSGTIDELGEAAESGEVVISGPNGVIITGGSVGVCSKMVITLTGAGVNLRPQIELGAAGKLVLNGALDAALRISATPETNNRTIAESSAAYTITNTDLDWLTLKSVSGAASSGRLVLSAGGTIVLNPLPTETTNVSSPSALDNALYNASQQESAPTVIKLMGNITVPANYTTGARFTLASGRYAVIDLNGKRLSSAAVDEVFFENDGGLEIIDTSIAQSGYFFNLPYPAPNPLNEIKPCIENNGSLRLTSGTIGNPTQGSFIYIENNGDFVMTGGALGANGSACFLDNKDEAALFGGAFRGDSYVKNTETVSTLALGAVAFNSSAAGGKNIEINALPAPAEQIELLCAPAGDILVWINGAVETEFNIIKSSASYDVTAADAARFIPSGSNVAFEYLDTAKAIKVKRSPAGEMEHELNTSGAYTLTENITLNADINIKGKTDNPATTRTATLNLGGFTIDCGEYSINVGNDLGASDSLTFEINPGSKTGALTDSVITGSGASVMNISGANTKVEVYGVTISNTYAPAQGVTPEPTRTVSFSGLEMIIRRSRILGSDAVGSVSLNIKSGKLDALNNTRITGYIGLLLDGTENNPSTVRAIGGDANNPGYNGLVGVDIIARHTAIEVAEFNTITTISTSTIEIPASAQESGNTTALLNRGSITSITASAKIRNLQTGQAAVSPVAINNSGAISGITGAPITCASGVAVENSGSMSITGGTVTGKTNALAISGGSVTISPATALVVTDASGKQVNIKHSGADTFDGHLKITAALTSELSLDAARWVAGYAYVRGAGAYAPTENDSLKIKLNTLDYYLKPITADKELELTARTVRNAATADQLKDALELAGSSRLNPTIIKLTANITVPYAYNDGNDSAFKVDAGAYKTLNLNGKTLRFNVPESGERPFIINEGSLVIADSVGSGMITSNSVALRNKAAGDNVFTLESGALECTKGGYGYAALENLGAAKLAGGEIKGVDYAVINNGSAAALTVSPAASYAIAANGVADIFHYSDADAIKLTGALTDDVEVGVRFTELTSSTAVISEEVLEGDGYELTQGDVDKITPCHDGDYYDITWSADNPVVFTLTDEGQLFETLNAGGQTTAYELSGNITLTGNRTIVDNPYLESVTLDLKGSEIDCGVFTITLGMGVDECEVTIHDTVDDTNRITGAGASTLLVNSGISLTAEDFVIENTGSSAAHWALNNDGGYLELTNCDVRGSEAAGGGGIYNIGQIESLIDCYVYGYTAIFNGTSTRGNNGVITSIADCEILGKNVGIYNVNSIYAIGKTDAQDAVCGIEVEDGGEAALLNHGSIEYIKDVVVTAPAGADGALVNRGEILDMRGCTFSGYATDMGDGYVAGVVNYGTIVNSLDNTYEGANAVRLMDGYVTLGEGDTFESIVTPSGAAIHFGLAGGSTALRGSLRVTAPLAADITLSVDATADGYVVARGAGAHTLNAADLGYLDFTHTLYELKLDTVGNAIVLKEKAARTAGTLAELQAALDGASDDPAAPTTIKLTAAIAVPYTHNAAEDSALEVEAGKYVILNLNGKTLSYANAETQARPFIINNGSLVITDGGGAGKITSDYVAARNSPTGDLSLEGGSLECSAWGGFEYAALENLGVANLVGGAIKGVDYGVINKGADAKLTIGTDMTYDVTANVDIFHYDDADPIVLSGALRADVGVGVRFTEPETRFDDVGVFVGARGPEDYVPQAADKDRIKSSREGDYYDIAWDGGASHITFGLTDEGKLFETLNSGEYATTPYTTTYTLVRDITLTGDRAIVDNPYLDEVTLDLGGNTIDCGEYLLSIGEGFGACEVALNGSNGVITGDGVNTVYIDSGITLTASEVTFENINGSVDEQWAVYNGGGLVTLTNCVIDGSDTAGGGLMNEGKIIALSSCNIEGYAAIHNGLTLPHLSARGIITLIENTVITGEYYGIYNVNTITEITGTTTIETGVVGSAALYNLGAIGTISDAEIIAGGGMSALFNSLSGTIYSLKNCTVTGDAVNAAAVVNYGYIEQSEGTTYTSEGEVVFRLMSGYAALGAGDEVATNASPGDPTIYYGITQAGAALKGSLRLTASLTGNPAQIELTAETTANGYTLMQGAGYTLTAADLAKLIFTGDSQLSLNAAANAIQFNKIPPVSVRLNKTSTIIAKTDSETLTATISPANHTGYIDEWLSDNTAVATVARSGDYTASITAVGAGTARITVKTDNGKTAVCTVTVKEKLQASWISFTGASSFEYSGRAHTPAYTVNNGSAALVLNRDFKAKYINNVNVGTGGANVPSIELTGMGNYAGTAVKTFTITQKALQPIFLQDYERNQYYTGDPIDPIVLVFDGMTLVKGVDYEIVFAPGNVNIALNVTATITGINNYSDSVGARFNIVGTPLDATMVATIPPQEFIVGHGAVEPELSIGYGARALDENTDYTVTYLDNTDAGTATAEIEGINEYSGKVTIPFTIKTRALTKDMIVLPTDPADYVYSGDPLELVSLVDGASPLTEGVDDDYVITYRNNNKVGTASATITGKNSYKGSLTVTYKITPQPLTDNCALDIDPAGTFDFEFSNAAKRPPVTVTNGYLREDLKLNADYTVVYTNNLNAGADTAIVTVKGKGNYSGELTDYFTIDPKAATLAVAAIRPQIYTGGPIEPAAVVKDGARTLKKDVDYTVVYADNVDAGGALYPATVTVTGIDNYDGSSGSGEFVINPVAISRAKITLPNYMQYDPFSGSATAVPTLTFGANNTTLIRGSDYSLSYTNTHRIGTATVRIDGAGNFSGYINKTYRIVAGAVMEDCRVDSIAPQIYTGAAIKPTPTVTNASGIILTAGRDFVYSYQNNVNVGTATLIVTGRSGYVGAKTVTFDIDPATLSDSSVTIAPITDKVYTGSEIKPPVTVKWGTRTLRLNTDYTVIYSDNIDVNAVSGATPTIDIDFRGNFAGSASTTFNITPFDANKLSVAAIPTQYFDREDMYFDPEEIEPLPVVKHGKDTLAEDPNNGYTLSYEDNRYVGRASVLIEGHGNYAGVKTVYFNIARRPITTNEFVVAGVPVPAEVVYDGTAQTFPNLTLEYTGYDDLLISRDYRVAYSNNVRIGTARITITGQGDYSGSRVVTFKILGKPITVDPIQGTFVYNGAQHRPLPTVKYGGSVLRLNVDYTVSYLNNVNAGVNTATVIVTGKGDYAGRVVRESFTIQPKTATLTIAAVRNQTYDGIPKQPALTVRDGSKTLKFGVDYVSGYVHNKNMGTAMVTVTGVGNYTAQSSSSANFKIVMPTMAFTGATNPRANDVTLTWRAMTGAQGYQIQYSESRLFPDGATEEEYIPDGTQTSISLSGLTPGTTYYFRIAMYDEVQKGEYGAIRTLRVTR